MTMVAQPKQQRSSGFMNHPYQQVTLLLFIVIAIGLSTFQRDKPPPESAASVAMSTDVAVVAQTPCQHISYKLVNEGTYGRRNFTRYSAHCDDGARPVTISEWASAGGGDDVGSLVDLIRASKYEGVFFETKGCSASNASTKNFEFVLVNAPHLKSFAEREPDSVAFAEYTSCGEAGCVFTNLGGDATLIAPSIISSNGDDDKDLVKYSHLAAFCRYAPPEQVAEVWKVAIQQYAQRLSRTKENDSVWFSTCGLGVAWLHFRLDRRPKYYQYRPFANES